LYLHRWYLAERQRKKADEADALAMHQRYYQRMGVEAWLRVGLARRQERLANLAQTQVRQRHPPHQVPCTINILGTSVSD
jgi:hypothetical protein